MCVTKTKTDYRYTQNSTQLSKSLQPGERVLKFRCSTTTNTILPQEGVRLDHETEIFLKKDHTQKRTILKTGKERTN